MIHCLLTYAAGDEYVNELKNYAIKKDIDGNLTWLGYLNQTQMAEIFNSCDIVVSVPSSDSSPKSVYEAMFCKKPVILSNLTWTYEFFKGPNYFLRVEPCHSVSLADSIEYYIDNYKTRVLHAENCYLKVFGEFDYHINMKKLDDILIKFKQIKMYD